MLMYRMWITRCFAHWRRFSDHGRSEGAVNIRFYPSPPWSVNKWMASFQISALQYWNTASTLLVCICMLLDEHLQVVTCSNLCSGGNEATVEQPQSEIHWACNVSWWINLPLWCLQEVESRLLRTSNIILYADTMARLHLRFWHHRPTLHERLYLCSWCPMSGVNWHHTAATPVWICDCSSSHWWCIS